MKKLFITALSLLVLAATASAQEAEETPPRKNYILAKAAFGYSLPVGAFGRNSGENPGYAKAGLQYSLAGYYGMVGEKHDLLFGLIVKRNQYSFDTRAFSKESGLADFNSSIDQQMGWEITSFQFSPGLILNICPKVYIPAMVGLGVNVFNSPELNAKLNFDDNSSVDYKFKSATMAGFAGSLSSGAGIYLGKHSRLEITAEYNFFINPSSDLLIVETKTTDGNGETRTGTLNINNTFYNIGSLDNISFLLNYGFKF